MRLDARSIAVLGIALIHKICTRNILSAGHPAQDSKDHDACAARDLLKLMTLFVCNGLARSTRPWPNSRPSRQAAPPGLRRLGLRWQVCSRLGGAVCALAQKWARLRGAKQSPAARGHRLRRPGWLWAGTE